jgi:hypothetical protein
MPTALRARDCFDDDNACFFGVSTDHADQGHLKQIFPGYRCFWDFERGFIRRYGVEAAAAYRTCSLLLDQRLGVLAPVPCDGSPEAHASNVVALLGQQMRIEELSSADAHAPVLIVPRIFEADFCAELVDYFQRGDPEESGFTREHEGRTVPALDTAFDRRQDVAVLDEQTAAACRGRLTDRLKPEVMRQMLHCVAHHSRESPRYMQDAAEQTRRTERPSAPPDAVGKVLIDEQERHLSKLQGTLAADAASGVQWRRGRAMAVTQAVLRFISSRRCRP